MTALRPPTKESIELDFPEGIVTYEFHAASRARRVADIVRDLVPFCDRIVELGTGIAKSFNKPVTCAAGCGVCCCQLVPLSIPEAIIITEVVEGLPSERKRAVRKLFAHAHDRCAKLGILTGLYANASTEEVLDVNRQYFELGIPCPFLVDGSCGIYASRQSRCREYSVLSPAALCANSFDEPVKRLPITLRLCEALAMAWASLTKTKPTLIPLIDAPSWVAKHPEARSLAIEGEGQFVGSVLEYACASANKRARLPRASELLT